MDFEAGEGVVEGEEKEIRESRAGALAGAQAEDDVGAADDEGAAGLVPDVFCEYILIDRRLLGDIIPRGRRLP